MSNLIGIYPNSNGTLDGAPQLWSANTNDDNATVIATGYFNDKADILKNLDVMHIIVDEDGTPALVRGNIVVSGSNYTLVPFA